MKLSWLLVPGSPCMLVEFEAYEAVEVKLVREEAETGIVRARDDTGVVGAARRPEAGVVRAGR